MNTCISRSTLCNSNAMTWHSTFFLGVFLAVVSQFASFFVRCSNASERFENALPWMLSGSRGSQNPTNLAQHIEVKERYHVCQTVVQRLSKRSNDFFPKYTKILIRWIHCTQILSYVFVYICLSWCLNSSVVIRCPFDFPGPWTGTATLRRRSGRSCNMIPTSGEDSHFIPFYSWKRWWPCSRHLFIVFLGFGNFADGCNLVFTDSWHFLLHFFDFPKARLGDRRLPIAGVMLNTAGSDRVRRWRHGEAIRRLKDVSKWLWHWSIW